MIKARIYCPTKTTMQSGFGNQEWLLEFTPHTGARFIDPEMGWTSSYDMMQQIRMSFPTVDAAKEFADKNDISYEVIEMPTRKLIKKNYADNFQ